MLVNRLPAQYELVVLGKRMIEIEAEAKVVHRLVDTVGHSVLVFHLAAGKSVLRLVHGIHLRTLGEDAQSDVVVTHGSGALVALEAVVAELDIAADGGFVGRLLGNDVDGTGYGAAAIESRPGTFHDFEPVDVIGAELLQSIYACKTGIDRLAVDEHLRVLSTQPLHADFGEVAELALLFHADARYALECFVEVLSVLLGECL